MEFKEFLALIQSSSNVALCMAVYFIWKASERLARIEKALDKFMSPPTP